ncbi:MAG: hypothetical protein RJB66_1872 [Pseudomonadota bacterium]|jgi:hypothetical protein
MINNSSLKLNEQVRNGLKGLLVIFSGLLILLAFGACQNSRVKSSPPPYAGYPGGYYPGTYSGALCPSCGADVPWTIFAGTDSRSASGSIMLGLDFYGDPRGGFNFMDPKVPTVYTGPVVARGLLTVNVVDPLICSVPVGQYQIISMTPGTWASGVVSAGMTGWGPTSMKLQAVSQFGVMILLSLAKGIIYNPTTGGTTSWYPNNLGGTLLFEQVNGMPCYSLSGPTYTEMY